MAPSLIDEKIAGKTRKAVVYGSKTGMFYILDRTNGTPLTPIDERPCRRSLCKKPGRRSPIQGRFAGSYVPDHDRRRPAACEFQSGLPVHATRYQLVVQTPGTGRGAHRSAMSYDPRTHLIYTGAGIVSTAHSLSDHGVFFRPLGEQRGLRSSHLTRPRTRLPGRGT